MLYTGYINGRGAFAVDKEVFDTLVELLRTSPEEMHAHPQNTRWYNSKLYVQATGAAPRQLRDEAEARESLFMAHREVAITFSHDIPTGDVKS